MLEKSRFLHEDTHSRIKLWSGTNNMEGGERCAFCSWKYCHYFELLQKNTHTQMLDQVLTQPGKCRPDPARGSVRVSAENLKSGRWRG